MSIAVCVITYQRPDGLTRLLHGLNQLIFNKCDVPDLEIIVVDNDSSGSACTLCERISLNLKWSLKCYIEPRRGIPYARNKAIASVGEDVDFIAFIDDDEVPEPVWLDELLYTQQLYKADVVTGPVLPYFMEPVPTWIEKFFHRSSYLTGYCLEFAATNNTLVCSKVFKKMDKNFDERLALTGGSDKEFFLRVYRAGHKIVWANDALVYEWIPKSRTNMRWILQRSYRLGNTDGLCKIKSKSSFSGKLMVFTIAIWRMILIVMAVLFIPLSLGLGRHLFVKTLRSICRSAGIIAGLAEKRYEEYRLIHKV